MNSPTELDDLSDDELFALAFEWRTRALHGERDANGRAHELEREVRRRMSAVPTLGAVLPNPQRSKKVWWAFWRSQ